MSSGYWVGMIQTGTRVHNSAGGAVLRTTKQNEDISWTTELEGWAHVSSNFGAGWVRSGDIYDRQWISTGPSYSKASPPTSLQVPEIAEGTVEITYSGAKGGTNNTIRGYLVEAADSEDGSAWSAWAQVADITSTAASGVLSVAVNPTRGAYRKYRVRTKGAAGASWYSNWSAETSAVRTNRAPLSPTVEVGHSTYSRTPVLRIVLAEEPDGQAQTCFCNGQAMELAEGKASLRLHLGVGQHSLQIKVEDGLGASVTVTHNLEVLYANYARTIQAGALISTASYKHVAEIQELYTQVNVCRAYYGLGALEVPSTIGLFGQWKVQMEALMTGLDECVTLCGAVPKVRPVLQRSYPKADVVNFIRQYLREV